jgi:hypothetical protein
MAFTVSKMCFIDRGRKVEFYSASLEVDMAAF